MITHIPIDDALPSLTKSGNLFSALFEDHNITIEIYKPEREDFQSPHDRDELYMIIAGSGTFKLRDETMLFKRGDLLLVPAGVVHRFENFTEDFATWVIFYGRAKIETEE
jgi:mannose-6-phosphate isomerase-like protein (cupin superfamily)